MGDTESLTIEEISVLRIDRLVAWMLLAATGFSTIPDVCNAAPEPTVTIAEAEKGEVKLASGLEQVSFKLTIVNRSPTPAKGIRIVTTPFRDATLREATIQAEPSAFDLDGLASTTLVVSATLTSPGEHAARVWLSQPGYEAALTTLRVSRTAKAPALSLGELVAVKADTTWWFGSGTSDAQVLRIRESAGVAASMPLPRLQSMVYKPSATVSVAAPGSLAIAEKEIKVEPGQTTDVSLRFINLPSAGRYDATLVFESPASAPVTRSVAIYARDPAWLAILFIALGLALAFGLRYYSTLLAPRQAMQARAALLFQLLSECTIEANGDAAATARIEALRIALVERWDAAARSGRPVTSAELEPFEARLPLLQQWLRLRAWLPASLSSGAKDLAKGVLNDAGTTITNLTATAEALKQAADKLSTLPDEVAKRTRQDIKDSVKQLLTDLAPLDDDKAEVLRQRLATLTERMDSGDPVGLTTELDELQVAYVGLQADALSDLLFQQPDGLFDDADWVRLRDSVEGALGNAQLATDAATAFKRYLAAERMLARPILRAIRAEPTAGEALRQEAQELQTLLHANPTAIGLPKLARLLDQRAQDRQKGGKLESISAMTDLLQKLSGIGAVRGSAFLELPTAVLPAAALQAPEALGQVRGEAARTAGAAVIVTSLVTIALGVQFLWINDWTWGGPVAYLAAFLWGAGLSGFSFTTMPALFERVVK